MPEGSLLPYVGNDYMINCKYGARQVVPKVPPVLALQHLVRQVLLHVQLHAISSMQ